MVRLMLWSQSYWGGKRIPGCYSKTCNEAVRGDMGLETRNSHRDKELKWWYKLATMPEDRYTKQLFCQECNVKWVGRGKPGVR